MCVRGVTKEANVRSFGEELNRDLEAFPELADETLGWLGERRKLYCIAPAVSLQGLYEWRVLNDLIAAELRSQVWSLEDVASIAAALAGTLPVFGMQSCLVYELGDYLADDDLAQGEPGQFSASEADLLERIAALGPTAEHALIDGVLRWRAAGYEHTAEDWAKVGVRIVEGCEQHMPISETPSMWSMPRGGGQDTHTNQGGNTVDGSGRFSAIEATVIEHLTQAAAAATTGQVHVRFDRNERDLTAETRWEDACRRCWEPLATGNVEAQKHTYGLLHHQHSCGYHNEPTAALVCVGDRMIYDAASRLMDLTDAEDAEGFDVDDAAADWADDQIRQILAKLARLVAAEQNKEIDDIRKDAAEFVEQFVRVDLAGLRYVDEVDAAVNRRLVAEEHSGEFDPVSQTVTFHPDLRFEALADADVDPVVVEVPREIEFRFLVYKPLPVDGLELADFELWDEEPLPNDRIVALIEEMGGTRLDDRGVWIDFDLDVGGQTVRYRVGTDVFV